MHRVFFWLSSFSITAAFENEFLLPTQTDQSGRGDGRGRGGSYLGKRLHGWGKISRRSTSVGPRRLEKKKPWTLSPLSTPGIWQPPGSSVRSGRDRRVWAWWESAEKEEKKKKERRRGHKRPTAGCSQQGLNAWERLGSKSGLGGGEGRRCERTVAFKQREGPPTDPARLQTGQVPFYWPLLTASGGKTD